MSTDFLPVKERKRFLPPLPLKRLTLPLFFSIVLITLLVCSGCSAAPGSSGVSEYRLVKASISDCTTSDESASEVDTAGALLEGLSFAQGNPFFLNIRETLTADSAIPVPTSSYIEKCEWTYDVSGRCSGATMYKSTNELSSVALSYDANGSISKVVGSVTMDTPDGNGQTQHDFELSAVNESLGSGAYGANKFTVVHSDSTSNDTVLFTYDKDKNITRVESSGKHEYTVDVEYVTAFKVPKAIYLSQDGEDGGDVLVPTYDAENKLVMLETGTWKNSSEKLDGLRYEIQYSGTKFSKMRVYSGDTEQYYMDFTYDSHGNLSGIRAYGKDSIQLYNIFFDWSLG